MIPFATPSELATYLQTATQAEAEAGATDVLDTGLALQMLEAASATIRAICGWDISETTVTEVIPLGDFSGAYRVAWSLFLPTLNLTALSITWNGSAMSLNSDFVWWRNGAVRLSPSRYWGSSFNEPTVEFTYTHGYDPVPDVVKAVCLELAAAKMELVSPRQLVSSTVDGVTDVYGRGGMAAYDPSLELRLSAYRLPAIA